MVAILLLLFNIFAFMQIYVDKRKAEEGKRRIPERHIFLVAALGGWPGSFLAQQLFRHKTKKGSFKVAFWIAASVSVLGYMALISQMR